jgi:DNA topoisomerase-6 subunit B
MPKKGGKAGKLQTKSPAEFFADNKNIAGFDNAGKSLYTTIRELVENGLDACEQIGQLPAISVKVEEVSKEKFNEEQGIRRHERIDDSMYRDHETDKDRKKREAKEKREAAAAAKKAAKAGGDPAAAAAAAASAAPKAARGGKKQATYFRVTVRDNGCGMQHDDIPNMLGRVLSGTKYGVRQARGKFGLGSKMALIWSKMSTGMPVEISSAQYDKRTGGGKKISYCKLDIDIRANAPNIIQHDKLENEKGWHGTEMKVIIEGNWAVYRARIVQYMRLMAVITPYAAFDFSFESSKGTNNLHMKFTRRATMMPPYPSEVKYHPSSIDLETLKQLHADSKQQTVLKFLMRDFSCMDKQTAEATCLELSLDGETSLTEIDDRDLTAMNQKFHELKFPKPDGKCLSPAGEYNLMLGIQKQMAPEFIATHQERVSIFEGHPFIVEVGVCIGSSRVKKPGIQVFRFANRIPMLFEGGSDVTTRVAKNMKWGNFKISKANDKIGVFTSIVSTKIPFKGTSKEYIGADAQEIHDAIKHGVTVCAGSLSKKIARRKSMREKETRKRNLEKYVGDVSGALWTVLEYEADEADKAGAQEGAAPPAKRARGAAASAAAAGSDSDEEEEEEEEEEGERSPRLEGDEMEVLQQVGGGEVTEQTLIDKLMEHIDNAHFEGGGDGGVGGGDGLQEREDFYLAPRTAAAAAAAAAGSVGFNHLVETEAYSMALNILEP